MLGVRAFTRGRGKYKLVVILIGTPQVSGYIIDFFLLLGGKKIDVSRGFSRAENKVSTPAFS